jgi:hypothetical protein
MVTSLSTSPLPSMAQDARSRSFIDPIAGGGLAALRSRALPLAGGHVGHDRPHSSTIQRRCLFDVGPPRTPSDPHRHPPGFQVHRPSFLHRTVIRTQDSVTRKIRLRARRQEHQHQPRARLPLSQCRNKSSVCIVEVAWTKTRLVSRETATAAQARTREAWSMALVCRTLSGRKIRHLPALNSLSSRRRGLTPANMRWAAPQESPSRMVALARIRKYAPSTRRVMASC